MNTQKNVLYLGEAYGPNTMGKIIINTMQKTLLTLILVLTKIMMIHGIDPWYSREM